MSLWGAYAFTDNRSGDFNFRRGDFGSGYLGAGDAWGGGVDAKYFFKRYFGVGIEGYIFDARRTDVDTILSNVSPHVIIQRREVRRSGRFLARSPCAILCPARALRPMPTSVAAPSSAVGNGMCSEDRRFRRGL